MEIAENTKGAFWFQILKATVNALLITLVSVLVFALIIKFASLSDSVIKPVNQMIKLVSIFLGCFISLREGKELVKGVIAGLIFTVLSFLIFSLLAGSISFDWFTVIDIVCGAVLGGISGVICKFRKNR